MNLKLPRNLAFNIASNKSLKRGMGIYLYLKVIETSGVIIFNDKAQKEAAIWLRCTQRTIQNWLKEAQTHNLITKINDTQYSTLSWNDVRERFDVLYTGYYYIPLGTAEIKDIFLTKFILEQKERCKAAHTYKSSVPQINQEIINAVQKLGVDASNESIKNVQIFDWRTGSRHLDPLQRFAIFFCNPDFETGSKRLSELLGYKGKGTLAYQKRRLKAQGMIDVTSRKVTVNAFDMPFMTTKARRQTNLGHVQYFRADKTLNLFMADQINFNPYCQWSSSKTLKAA